MKVRSRDELLSRQKVIIASSVGGKHFSGLLYSNRQLLIGRHDGNGRSLRDKRNKSEPEDGSARRLSSCELDQKELRQLDGLTLDKRFVDKASGKDPYRPQLEQLTGYVRDGDTVICHSMDRLARKLDDLRKIVLGFTERGVHVRFERENLTLTGRDSPMSHLLLSVMGAFAQFERDLIRERQREGIELAKLRKGPYTGRKHSLTPLQARELQRRFATGESKTALAGELGISRQTS